MPREAEVSFRTERARSGARLRMHGLLALVSFALAASGSAQEPNQQWAPSFGISFDLQGQRLRADIASGDVLGPPLPVGCERSNGTTPNTLCPRAPSRPPEPKIGPDQRGNDTLVAPLMTLAFELMTPRLSAAAFEPRPFLHADLGISFGFERNLAGDGQPSGFGIPPFLPPSLPIPEIGVVGQGSRALAQLEDLSVMAGVGVAFSVPLLGRPLRIKPSVEYLRERFELRGEVRRAVAFRDPAQTLDDFRFIALAQESAIIYHGLGLGLEIEMDTARFGPIQTVVFLGGRGYRLLGRQNKTLHARNEFGEAASWTFEAEPWVWRGSAGMRFRWNPKGAEARRGGARP